MVTLSMFQHCDREDVKQQTRLYELEDRKHPFLQALRDHNQFVQYSQGRAKTATGVEDHHTYEDVPPNETAEDILSLFTRKNCTDNKRNQVKQIITCYSEGLNQRETSEKTGIHKSRISDLTKEIREILKDCA